MTITEKILAAHAGLREVHQGQLVKCKLDIVMANDITAPIAIRAFEGVGGKQVFDRDRIVLMPSHFAPNKDIQSAEQCKIMKEFAKKHQITHYYEVGEAGIEHAFMPERGLIVPGDCYIGADSHSCTPGALRAFCTGVGSTDLAAAFLTGETWFKVPESMKFIYTGKLKKWVTAKDLILYCISRIGCDGALYKAMEHTGEVIQSLPMEDRLTMTNMAIEAGGKSGIIEPDEITLEYIKPRATRPYKLYKSDPDASYSEVYEFKASEIDLQVACPYSPDNVKPLTEVGEVAVDQVFIGSCTNAKISDLRIAAKILRGRRAHPSVRLIVIPATQEAYRQALKEGLIEVFAEARAVITAGTCGPCLGGYMGVVGDGEVCVSTSNRNFRGRMGHPNARVYLTSAAVAAATAIKGRIAHPDEVAGSES